MKITIEITPEELHDLLHRIGPEVLTVFNAVAREVASSLPKIQSPAPDLEAAPPVSAVVVSVPPAANAGIQPTQRVEPPALRQPVPAYRSELELTSDSEPMKAQVPANPSPQQRRSKGERKAIRQAKVQARQQAFEAERKKNEAIQAEKARADAEHRETLRLRRETEQELKQKRKELEGLSEQLQEHFNPPPLPPEPEAEACSVETTVGRIGTAALERTEALEIAGRGDSELHGLIKGIMCAAVRMERHQKVPTTLAQAAATVCSRCDVVSPDEPCATDLHHWLRDYAHAHGVYLNHMRRDAPATKKQAADAVKRIHRSTLNPKAPVRKAVIPKPKKTNHNDRVQAMADLLGGRELVLLVNSGVRPHVIERAAKENIKIRWVTYEGHSSIETVRPDIEDPGVGAVMAMIRWLPHAANQAKEIAQARGTPYITVPGGFGLNSLANAMFAQASRQFA